MLLQKQVFPKGNQDVTDKAKQHTLLVNILLAAAICHQNYSLQFHYFCPPILYQ